MSRNFKAANLWMLGCCIALAMLLVPHDAHAYTFKVLHTFTGAASDGAYPGFGSLTKDKDGNLYGTTIYGGAHDAGVVFKLAPDGALRVLHSFTYDGTDGNGPYGGVIRDGAGNLYGATYQGGSPYDYGTIFKLAPGGTELVLHAFAGYDGAYPYDSLIRDSAGNLYGTTSEGGGGSCYENIGCGTAFRLAPDGMLTVLHAFSEDIDGAIPLGSLVSDKGGNLYGTTQGELTDHGTVFKVAPDGTETTLYFFQAGSDGYWPVAGPIRDTAGNLYGTTSQGGKTRCNDPYGCGTVFKLAPDGTKTILHSFNGRGGFEPFGTLIRNKAGELYGTTYYGGSNNEGVVFRLKADGTFKVLHSFACTSDGCEPYAGLVDDGAGNFYGTTSGGGTYNDGTVFEVMK